MKKLISLSIFVMSTLLACQSSPVAEVGVTPIVSNSSTVPAASSVGGVGGSSPENFSRNDGGVVGTSVPPMCFSPEGTRRLPDPILTPGKICSESDLDFDGYRYSRGAEKGVAYCRRHVTSKMKDTIAAAYGISKSDYSKFEFDHFIPLAAGGANEISNIWPQPIDDATSKDVIEFRIHNDLKSGKITQDEAISTIRSWVPVDCK